LWASVAKNQGDNLLKKKTHKASAIFANFTLFFARTRVKNLKHINNSAKVQIRAGSRDERKANLSSSTGMLLLLSLNINNKREAARRGIWSS